MPLNARECKGVANKSLHLVKEENGASDFHPTPKTSLAVQLTAGILVFWEHRDLDWLRQPDGRKMYENEYAPFNQERLWRNNVPLTDIN